MGTGLGAMFGCETEYGVKMVIILSVEDNLYSEAPVSDDHDEHHDDDQRHHTEAVATTKTVDTPPLPQLVGARSEQSNHVL